MNLIQQVENFRSINLNGYSHTSNNLHPYFKSIYVELYDLVLQHIINGDPDRIRKRLEEYRLQLQSGLLYENKKIIIGKWHSDLYVSLHLSSIYYQLVDYYIDDFPIIDFLEKISKEGLYSKLDELDYSDAWRVSNEIMSYAVLLSFNAKRGCNVDSVEWCFDYIESRQNKISGLWASENKKSILNSLAATFHYLPLYDFLKKPVKNPKKILDSVLSLKLPNGFFSSPAGYACIDYDCIAILFFLVQQDSIENFISLKQKNEISSIALELRQSIIDMINSDGGFPEFGREGNPVSSSIIALMSYRKHQCFETYLWNMKKIARLFIQSDKLAYSNSVLMCVSKPHESNSFSVWFRYMTILICEDMLEYLGQNIDRSAKPKRFDLPGLGRL
ncbi:hypothetical protein BHECKSOX_1407 [Bathymodiolus heckerae thiotrophic gill symbiont]|uniref:hypothetical protein n=1 Tax=Bathymodiolus heckerae thiotrophic gill symbiont TaxID=1052212 RepID=UPI0010B78FE5|nr:hypothetical protein [Bathymodiolus heckerae thiotrophic gill symbiont]CAC9526866.1 hypothetical protein [uncultured Gammaproteobacteria bacterium]CAC9602635.1 hypothetical protein [uncultured Gammaproteobacteria bacterium]CAC9964259.1 hypothetical protein [uncultured Gammaproteobacteria bacterium]SHN91138.1 hypothetical protein BHECKSOX_1407 [Bathymodiolus heckerae thiotrophic gill symbiont]